MNMVRVSPARNGLSWGGEGPYGTWDIIDATIYERYRFTQRGTVGSLQLDIAILTLSPIGSQVALPIGIAMGTFGVSKFPVRPSCCDRIFLPRCSTSTIQADEWRITGYPGDKTIGTMWDTGTCDEWVYNCGNPKVIDYTCDTAEGMSGSAIRDGEDKIIGVHAGGTTTVNYGVAIDDENLNNIQLILSGQL